VAFNGSSVSVNTLDTDNGGTVGLGYSITKSDDDLVISHTEIGRLADVVAAISGLRTVPP
jgi:hypothetical protein